MISYSLMTQRATEFNWAVNPNYHVQDSGVKNASWEGTKTVGGCWDLKLYNTNKKLSSLLYQHVHDGRCVLAVSGYHGSENGVLKTFMEAMQPAENWVMCDNQVHAPVVIQFRRHSLLANWSDISQFLGGEKSTCSDIVVAGDSMGGSIAELMVGCGTLGQMNMLQPKILPSFNIKAVYSFGAFAVSTKPLRNASAENGCINGKRFFHSGDKIAQWTKGLGMVHPAMDALRLYEGEAGNTYDSLRCTSQDTSHTDMDVDIPFTAGGISAAQREITRKTQLSMGGSVNVLTAHAMPHYVKQLRGISDNGKVSLYSRIDYASLLKNGEYSTLIRDI